MKITVADIRAKKPCHDPTKYVAEGWTGSLLDILNLEAVPALDRIWVVTQFLDDSTNRLFAVWCAREALKLIDNPDQRSVAACDVAERFANGAATTNELRAAEAAAWTAAWTAAGAAAEAAAWTAARAAAWAAAGAAAWTAARANDTAAVRANDTAAVRAAQIEKLKEMIG
jgi:hypothetical protein